MSTFGGLTKHTQTMTKEHYYDWYKHSTNKFCYTHLILENSLKSTKLIILEWKTDEGWSYEWCNYYNTVGYQILTNVKVRVIEIRNKNTSIVFILH